MDIILHLTTCNNDIHDTYDPVSTWHIIYRRLISNQDKDRFTSTKPKHLSSKMASLAYMTQHPEPVESNRARGELNYICKIIVPRYLFFHIIRLDLIEEPRKIELCNDFQIWLRQHKTHRLLYTIDKKKDKKKTFVAYLLLRNLNDVMTNISSLTEYLGSQDELSLVDGQIKVWVDCTVRNLMLWKLTGKFKLLVSCVYCPFTIDVTIAKNTEPNGIFTTSSKPQGYDRKKTYKLIVLTEEEEVRTVVYCYGQLINITILIFLHYLTIVHYKQFSIM